MSQSSRTPLSKLQLSAGALRHLLVDETGDVFDRRQVPGAHFALAKPTAVDNPRVVAICDQVFKDILQLKAPSELEDQTEQKQYLQAIAQAFSGNSLLPGSEPAAHCYCGFQFGNFAGQLGDGRAMYLGEAQDHELQLKGAGPTPFSRTADGRAVLRSSIREFLCSEAMFALDIPTTRAGTLIVADSKAVRDRNYDGNAKEEPMAIVCRIAPTFLRFGSFQICMQSEDRRGPSFRQDEKVLPPLLNYLIENHFPEIQTASSDSLERYKLWIVEITRRTARTVAMWQCVGFCHGVLNTDNLSAIGVTIDYGPFGFMERFHKTFICNSSDDGGRYSYEKQPEMCKWNLLKLVEGLDKIIPTEETRQLVEDNFDSHFAECYREEMRKKLGLTFEKNDELIRGSDDSKFDSVDDQLFEQLFDIMEQTAVDMTNTFRMLSKLKMMGAKLENQLEKEEFVEEISSLFGSLKDRAAPFKPTTSDAMLHRYVAMAQQNPMMLFMAGKSAKWLIKELENRNKYVELMNGEEEIDLEKDKQMWIDWITSFQNTFEERFQTFSETDSKLRVESMNRTNPKFVLRNWVAEKAIRAAEDCNDFSLVNELLTVLENPYSEQHDEKYEQFCTTAPLEMSDSLTVS